LIFSQTGQSNRNATWSGTGVSMSSTSNAGPGVCRTIRQQALQIKSPLTLGHNGSYISDIELRADSAAGYHLPNRKICQGSGERKALSSTTNQSCEREVRIFYDILNQFLLEFWS
jgi:hypothetical protein